MGVRARSWLGPIAAVLLAVVVAIPVAASGPGIGEAQTVIDVEFLGEIIVPTGTVFDGTEIGGLSSITYDPGRGVYYVLSDDQGNRATGDPVRYYTVAIDLSDGRRWARLPYDFLEHVSLRIINEVDGISRVTYDISGKPPSTIEWE